MIIQYAAFRQIDLSGYDGKRIASLVDRVKDNEFFDGYGDKTIFLKFAKFVPDSEENIAICRRLNEDDADAAVLTIKKAFEYAADLRRRSKKSKKRRTRRRYF